MLQYRAKVSSNAISSLCRRSSWVRAMRIINSLHVTRYLYHLRPRSDRLHSDAQTLRHAKLTKPKPYCKTLILKPKPQAPHPERSSAVQSAFVSVPLLICTEVPSRLPCPFTKLPRFLSPAPSPAPSPSPSQAHQQSTSPHSSRSDYSSPSS